VQDRNVFLCVLLLLLLSMLLASLIPTSATPAKKDKPTPKGKGTVPAKPSSSARRRLQFEGPDLFCDSVSPNGSAP
jgi:hypothetical protein